MSSATFLTFLGGIIAASITAVYQLFSLYSARRERETDRRIALTNLKREAYQRYLSSYIRMLAPRPRHSRLEEAQAQEAANEEYLVAYNALLPIATDAVFLAATEFHAFVWIGDTNIIGEAWVHERANRYTDLLTEIRKDAFGETPLGKDDPRIPW
jgi:hypothetical protein